MSGVLLFGFFCFPIELIGIILEVIGLTIIRNNHVAFKISWILEGIYGIIYCQWMLKEKFGIDIGYNFVNFGWMIRGAMMISLIAGIAFYYKDSAIKKASMIGVVLVGMRMVLYLTYSIWSKYIISYPVVYIIVNIILLMDIFAISTILWKCYKIENNNALK